MDKLPSDSDRNVQGTHPALALSKAPSEKEHLIEISSTENGLHKASRWLDIHVEVEFLLKQLEAIVS